MALTRRGAGSLLSLWFAAAATVGLLAGTAVASPLDDGAQAYAAGNYRRAHDLLLPLANAGNADAAFRLGLMADLGEGGPEDAAAAHHWYRRAAEAGDAAAEFNVAVMEDSGRGTPHDVADAAIWYARAAARGNHRAQYNLALLYTAGEGVPRNPAVARAWFRTAATDIPAAGEKLRALAHEPLPPANGAPDTTLHPASLVTPGPGAVLVPANDRHAELVWSAVAEARPVRYFLQVVVQQDNVPHEIYAASLDVTSALVPLEAGRHAYEWRVYTVSPGSGSYLVSTWNMFTAG